MAERIILHVDMDSFFTSIEVKRNPGLKGKPVVVGADPKGGKGRGVVSTCSYEARKYGIRSGMPISKAYSLNPNAVFLTVNMEQYFHVSRRVMEILRGYCEKFQQVSIDEAYLDISDRADDYQAAEEIARRIKAEIRQKEGLTCSIGIGPNKLIAKIASDMEKPDGLTIVRPERVEVFLAPLSVRCIPGVGPKSEKVLKRMGIGTIRALAKADLQELKLVFGKWGYEMQRLARGIDEREVRERGLAKSIGRERTFEEDTNDRGVIMKTLKELAEEVHEDAIKRGYMYRTITLKVRLEDFTTFTRSRTIERHTTSIESLGIIQELIEEFLDSKKIRLLGVRVSNLTRQHDKQKSLVEFKDYP
jgi:DNA polymerase IV (DinB-like DNA polymerase)